MFDVSKISFETTANSHAVLEIFGRSVQFAPYWRSSAEGEEDGASIPSDIVQLFKVVRDSMDGCSDDTLQTKTLLEIRLAFLEYLH